MRVVGDLNIETSALSGPPKRSPIGGGTTFGGSQPSLLGVSPEVRRKRGRAVNPKWWLSVLNVRQPFSSLANNYRRLEASCKREPRLVLKGDKLQRQNTVALPHGKRGGRVG